MNILVNLPRVSCQLHLSDGVADVESFRAGAARANWTNSQIVVAVLDAVYKSHHIDDVGEVLYQYCTDESWA